MYYNFIIRYDDRVLGAARDTFVAAVQAEGIPLGTLYYPLYRNRSFKLTRQAGRGAAYLPPLYDVPADQRPNYNDGACPVAEEYCDRRLIELKVHPPADQRDMADVVSAVSKVVDNIGDLAETPAPR